MKRHQNTTRTRPDTKPLAVLLVAISGLAGTQVAAAQTAAAQPSASWPDGVLTVFGTAGDDEQYLAHRSSR